VHTSWGNHSHLQCVYAVLQLIRQTLLMFLALGRDWIFNKQIFLCPEDKRFKRFGIFKLNQKHFEFVPLRNR
jgi:hypothetical protein